MPRFIPNLAAEGVLGKIKFPIIGLPKLNGVRSGNHNGELLARSLKPIPNTHTRTKFGGKSLSETEGELVVGHFADEEVFTNSTSGVMSRDGEPEVALHVFDWFHPTMPFKERILVAGDMVKKDGRSDLLIVEHKLLKNEAELVKYSDWALRKGYEGLVLRAPDLPYKEGRSTAKEGGFMRYCPWLRDEAVIIGVTEGLINLNESVRNELGKLRKSSHKDNKVGSGQAGTFQLRHASGIEFSVLVPTDALQKKVWANPNAYIGQLAKYKFKPAVNKNGLPRFAQFEGLRDPRDM